MTEKNAELISDICQQLDRADFYRVTYGCIEVAFISSTGEEVSAGPVGLMIMYLNESIHTDGDANDISDVVRVVVRKL